MIKKHHVIFDKHLSEILKGGGVTFIFHILNLITVYLLAIFISKSYGADAYGRFSIIKSMIVIFTVITTLGLNTLAIKLGSDVKHFFNRKFKSDFVYKSYTLILIWSSLICAIFSFFKDEIAVLFFEDSQLLVYFSFFPILLIASTFLNYNSNLFKGLGKILPFAILSAFLGNIILLTYVIIDFKSAEEANLILFLTLGTCLSLLISILLLFPIKLEKRIRKLQLRSLLSSSTPMMFSSSMIFIIFSIDVLMLGYFRTSEEVGVYRIISQISSLNVIFLIVFGTIVGPKISNLNSKGDQQELKKVIRSSTKLIFFATAPIFLTILIFSKKILSFFGPEYALEQHVLILLATAQFLYAVSGFVDLTLNMTGRQKVYTRITTSSAIANILLNIILVPLYGLEGAALSTAASVLLTNFISLIYIKRKLNLVLVYNPFSFVKDGIKNF